MPVLFDAAVLATVLALAIGIYLLVAPDSIVKAGPYTVPELLFSVRLWAVLFIVKGVIAAACIVRCDWWAASRVAFIGGALYTVWACCFVGYAIGHSATGTFGAMLMTYTALSHAALARALARQSLVVG